ncbi:MAG: flagellar hook-basal body complex protein FliE [Pseudomonadota bacterium]
MSVTGISSSVSALQNVQRPDHTAPAGQRGAEVGNTGSVQGPGFGARLGQALESVNAQQLRAAQAARDFEAGRTEDLVSVMVEQQVSSLGFEMTKQVRNRALSAYRDIMNMPV